MNQPKKKSGTQYRFNLDPTTFADLKACHQIQGNQFSNSVIARRAMRSYKAALENMTEEEIQQEVIEAQRAAKGIL